MVAMLTSVKRKAEMKAGRSPKFSMPMASAPRITVKFSHERKVRSLAKKTLGSTRVGRAMRFPARERVSFGEEAGFALWRGVLPVRAGIVIWACERREGNYTRRCLEEGL